MTRAVRGALLAVVAGVSLSAPSTVQFEDVASAAGIRIKLTAGGMVQIREIAGGGSYLSQSDLRAHFGLGSSPRADSAEIAWPSGIKQTFRNLAADRFYLVEEGKDPVPIEPLRTSAPPASLKNER